MEDLDLGQSTLALKALLEAKPGAAGAPMTAARGSKPLALIYKVMGKMFAILALRGAANVILKCEPHLPMCCGATTAASATARTWIPGSGSAWTWTPTCRPAKCAASWTSPTTSSAPG